MSIQGIFCSQSKPNDEMDLSIHCPSYVGAVKMDQQSTETISATQSNADHNGILKKNYQFSYLLSYTAWYAYACFSHFLKSLMRTVFFFRDRSRFCCIEGKTIKV